MDDRHLFEETVSSELIFDGKVVKLYRDSVVLENGEKTIREVIKHPGGVCVLPVDGDGNVYMVKQFRYAFGKILLEVPAGKLEAGEKPIDCGIRELKEEVGASADEVMFLGKLYPTVAYDTEIIYMYLAKGLHFSKQSLDPEEYLDVVKLPYSEAYKMVLRGELPDAKTQLAMLYAKKFIEN